MGCLNANQGFSHWFGNIHLSGPCNRSCYFCIGQHMMALDPMNTLDQWPLPGIHDFADECVRRGITDINLTGTNTDPLLYQHSDRLAEYLRSRIDGLRLGIRTNGVAHTHRLASFDKASFSIASFDRKVNEAIMGGPPSDLQELVRVWTRNCGRDVDDLKVNIVLCPENFDEIEDSIWRIAQTGIRRVNLREPYGQPHLGDPMKDTIAAVRRDRLGMPSYELWGVSVTYWDVHYVHVESVNLYANGRVSLDYPITRGHDDSGNVLDQSNFNTSGRVTPQWVTVGATND